MYRHLEIINANLNDMDKTESAAISEVLMYAS